MVKRIGLSQRIVSSSQYAENRDAIAHDWYSYMEKAFSGFSWILLPNIEDKVSKYLKDWHVDGIILTGGNDLLEAPTRDKTETALLDYGIQNRIPILGVCRGLQMIQSYFKGNIVKDPIAVVAQDHSVEIIQNRLISPSYCGSHVVNSFHHFGVQLSDLAHCLAPFALTSDKKWVEGFIHKTERIAGIQWHPERKDPSARLSYEIFQNLFNKENL